MLARSRQTAPSAWSTFIQETEVGPLALTEGAESLLALDPGVEERPQAPGASLRPPAWPLGSFGFF